jgi:amidophosphoribosyltransferase
VEGAYSLVCLTAEGMIACRDPLGIRPLVMGRLGDAYIFASETVALDVVGATYLRSVEPGELIIVSARGIQSHRPFAPVRPRPCIFEHVYFSRPDSIVDGASVYTVRKRIGAELARENPVDADYVVPVPDSGVPAAIGYAQESGVPFELGIIRSHYVGRTFIQPSDQVRHLGVKLKHNANTALIQGKKIVLIDDSIVRGTDVAQDRADAARVRRARGSHADRLAPDQAQLLLRRRHARARQAARRADERRADERIYPRRQPRLRVDRRPLPRAGRGGAGRSAAAALRRLLLRPVSDAADRP